MADTGTDSGNKLLGLFLVALGVLFLLGQLDFVDFGDIIKTWWPMILVVIALRKLLSRHEHGRAGGLILLGLGLFFQAIELGLFSWNAMQYVWPLILVGVGIKILLGPRAVGPKIFGGGGGSGSVDSDVVNTTAIFGGSELSVGSQQFKGGQATALFGGVELDLTKAKLAEESVTLNATAMFGSVELTVPEGWRVTIKGTPLFGGFENRAQSDDENAPTLLVNATAMFGGVEVHN